jgi:hypothetical protein
VEIIRLDHPTAPALGFALAFEFDETNGNYPYTPSFVVAQLKSYRWGGVEFSSSDSLNYSAVSNDVSDDISMEVDSFIQDTIYGHFSGLFLNGSGGMGGVESGTFKVKLHRH